MVIEGLPFVKFLLSALGIVFLAFGMGLALIGISGSADFDHFRMRFYHIVDPVLTTNWRLLPHRSIEIFVSGMNAYVDYWFRQSENNVVVSGLFIIIVLIGIPVGSVINLFRGGSTFLFWVIGAVLIALIIIAMTGEVKRFRGIAPPLSIMVFLTIFLFVPGYVFYSFTSHILQFPVGHAAIGGLLIVPLLYLVCQAASLGVRQILRIDQASGIQSLLECIISDFFAALPIAYILIFAALLAGQFSVAQQPLPMTWAMVLSCLVTVGLSNSLTQNILKWATSSDKSQIWWFSFILVGIFSVLFGFGTLKFGLPPESFVQSGLHNIMIGKSPDGEKFVLGPLFWLMHLTLVPFVAVVSIMVLTFFARIISQSLSIEFVNEIGHPRHACRAGGLAMGIFGLIGAGIAANI